MGTAGERAAVRWPDEVDEILDGDLVVGVGMPTPRGGVALVSVTPIGLRDRDAGTVGFTSSLGFGRKLERIAADPRIAVAYHTRQHARTSRPGYVLVQGAASIEGPLSDDGRRGIAEHATPHLGPPARGRFWDRWLRVYYYDRVIVTVTVQRILWWPGDDLSGAPTVLGEVLEPAPAPPQRPPREARTPRVPVARVAASARKLRQRLLGVLGADGLPLVLPVSVTGSGAAGLTLETATQLVPPGGRRAGLLFHDFRPKVVGLSTATHTGWLESDGELRWTPHTRHSFTAPPNKTLLLLLNGLAARVGYRRALREGRQRVFTGPSAGG